MSVDDGLRAIFRKKIRDAHWQTIERLLDRGVPDSNVCLSGSECWIEYKATKKWHVKVRPEQVGWLLARERHGGRTFVAVRRRRLASPRSEGCDELWLFRGSAVGVLADRGLAAFLTSHAPEGLLGRWDGGPGAWPWLTVRALLAHV